MDSRSAHHHRSWLTLGRVAHAENRQILRISGGGLLFVTGVIHLDLYVTGYRTVPTIGGLFLLQVIFSFGFAIAVLVWDSRLVAAASAGFVMATLMGYLLSLRIGLFGFREVRTTLGLLASVVEIIGFAVLALSALRPSGQQHPSEEKSARPLFFLSQKVAMRVLRWLAGWLALQAVLCFGVLWLFADTLSANTSTSRSVVKFTDLNGVSVLTNARGYTLYWFAPDSASKSVCYGSCAAYWPPVVGTPAPAFDVVGNFGTFKRTGGARQVTYDHHPLYTYIGDTSPGQANGNRINLNGGWWYEMRMSN